MGDTRRNGRVRQNYGRKYQGHRKKNTFPRVLFMIAAIATICFVGAKSAVSLNDLEVGEIKRNCRERGS